MTSLNNNVHGGAIAINTPNYSFFTINRCFFIECKSYAGGALCLYIPYVYITRTRFENNTHTYSSYGHDIYSNSYPCFNNNSISSSVCSTNSEYSILCSGYGRSIIKKCPEQVV